MHSKLRSSGWRRSDRFAGVLYFVVSTIDIIGAYKFVVYIVDVDSDFETKQNR